MASYDGIDFLKTFFRNEQLNKIAIFRAFHELWKRNDIQSEENDCNRLLEILNELMAENLDSDRKRHLISLQDINKNEIQNRCKFIIAPSETTRHRHWVEGENDRAQIATNITDILLQETKRNVRKIFKASENAFVDVVERLIEASIYQMPIDFDIEVTRNKRQSDASKKRKNCQVPAGNGYQQAQKPITIITS
ncbi:3532_t:CDS:2 [Entrophospora sp. SA101]|nr:3532_t:CDS:2 [Entrophospora sp. SA101]